MPASSTNETFTPKQRFGGESDVVTTSDVFASGNNVAELTVVARVAATGKIVPWAPGATDGSENAIGITVEAVDATSADKSGPYYIGGVFNPDELVWPGGATDAQKAAAFDRTNISLRTPKYST